MSIIIRTPLVGTHFHPPADLLLKHLPAGTPLTLDPDPTNPYDENAVRVLVSPTALVEPIDPELTDELPNYGTDIDEVLALDSIFLGHIGATGGKPLAKLQARYPELRGNVEVLAALAGSPEVSASLTFAAGGEPIVQVAVGGEGGNEL